MWEGVHAESESEDLPMPFAVAKVYFAAFGKKSAGKARVHPLLSYLSIITLAAHYNVVF